MFKKKDPLEIGLSMEDEIDQIRLAPKAVTPTEEGPPLPEPGDEGSWNDKNQQPNSLHYRQIKRTTFMERYRKNIILAVSATVFAVVFGIWGTLFFSEKARLFTMEKTKDLGTLVAGTRFAFAKPMLLKFHKSLRHRQLDMAAKKVVEPLAFSGLSCTNIVKEGIGRKLQEKLSADDRYLVVSCSMFNDSPQVALRQGMEGQHNIDDMHWEDASEYLLYSEAQRRLSILDGRPPAKVSQCDKWKFIPQCLVRFLDEARLPQPISKWEEGFKALEKDIKQQSTQTQAWFYMAAGLHAWKQGKNSDAHFKKAQELLGHTADPFLERELFRGRVRNAFQQKDAALMEAIWDERPFDRINEDPSAFLDTELMHGMLTTPVDAENQLRTFLDSPQSYQRFRFDMQWLRFVVEQSISAGMGDSGLTWIEGILQAGTSKDETRTADIFGLLHVRMLLAAEKYLDAVELLTKMERYAAKTAEWHQLRGLAMLGAANTRERRFQAAKEFQAATNVQPQSASPFALVVTFLELGQPLKAEQTLAFWGQMKREDDFYYVVARGLVRYSQDDVEQARQIWNDGVKKFPKKEFWKAVDRNLGEDPTYLKTDVFKRLKPMLANDSPLSALALWRPKP